MDEMRKIVAGYAPIGQGAGPMIVTERAGLFRKYGLDVATRLMEGGKGVARGLMAGEIQLGNLAAPALLKAGAVEGTDLVFLTGGINQQFLMSRAGIKSREQLAGGRVGLVGDGSVNDVFAYFAADKLEEQGVRGIRLVPIPSRGREVLNHLVRGDLEAAVITPPEAIDAKRAGCHFLIDFADYGLNYALGGIAVRRSFMDDNPETVRKFVRAYVEGMHRYRTDRDFTVQVQQDYSGISDRSIAEETYDLTQPGMPRVPYPVIPALATALKVMARKTPACAKADAHQFVDDRIIRELDEAGFIDSLYGR